MLFYLTMNLFPCYLPWEIYIETIYQRYFISLVFKLGTPLVKWCNPDSILSPITVICLLSRKSVSLKNEVFFSIIKYQMCLIY